MNSPVTQSGYFAVDTPGTSPLTEVQTDEMEARYGHRYIAVADGSKGGHTPGRKYGTGRMAATLKRRSR